MWWHQSGPTIRCSMSLSPIHYTLTSSWHWVPGGRSTTNARLTLRPTDGDGAYGAVGRGQYLQLRRPTAGPGARRNGGALTRTRDRLARRAQQQTRSGPPAAPGSSGIDRFTVPPGATVIARNDRAAQAFSHGRGLGLQFHPEVDVALRAAVDRRGHRRGHGRARDSARRPPRTHRSRGRRRRPPVTTAGARFSARCRARSPMTDSTARTAAGRAAATAGCASPKLDLGDVPNRDHPAPAAGARPNTAASS